MKWGTKIKYTAFIVLCSLAFAVSGISGVFSSFKTEGTSGFSIYYTAPEPVNLKAIQFQNYTSNVTSVTFDYYNDGYNSIIAKATSSYKVNANSDGSIMLYMVGTDIYVLSEGQIYATSCYQMFYNLTKITSIKFKNFNTSNVTDMRSMFYSCSKLTSLNLSSFDTTNVTSMSHMFQSCSGLKSLNLSSFNTSNVTNMSRMFDSCSGLTSLDLSSFNTSNVTDMSCMFQLCSGLTSLDLSNFNTSKVTTMTNMFGYCDRLTTIYVSDMWTTSGLIDNNVSIFVSCYDLVGGTGTAGNMIGYASSATVTGYLTHINSKLFKTYASNATSITFDYHSSQYDEIIFNADATYEVDDDNIGKCTLYIEGTEVYILSNNTITPKSGRCMLYGLKSLTTINFNNFDTSNVTNMSYMFYYCSGLTSLDLSSFNTSKVTNMSYMFSRCSGLISLDLSGWDTSKVTDMSSMFAVCSKLTTIYVSSTWRTTKVTSSDSMFTNCTLLVGGNGTKYSSSYRDATYARIDTADTRGYLTAITDTLTLGSIQFGNITSTATSITFDYYNEEYNTIISNADATYLVCASTEDKAMLYVVGTDVYILSNSEIYANESCYQMFYNMNSLTSIKFNNFNTSNVTSMSYMFSQSSGLISLDLSSWDTSNVTNMSYMFYYCSGLTSLDLSGWDTSKVTNMSDMFYSCRGLTTIYVSSSWSTTKVTSSTNMFYNCTKLVGGNGTTYSSSYIDKTYASIDKLGQKGYLTDINNYSIMVGNYASSATSVILDYYNDKYNTIIANATTSYIIGKVSDDIMLYVVDSMVYILSNREIAPPSCVKMFNNMTSLTSITFNNFNTSKVTNMSDMFYNCSGLTSLDLSGFNTSNVTYMSYMFMYCSGLTSLDLSSFNTSNVTDMSYMFYDCSGLTSLDLTPLDTSNVTSMGHMFDSCSELTSLNVSSFNTSKVTNMAYMFRGCSGLTNLNLSSFKTTRLNYMGHMFDSCSKLTSLDLSGFTTSNVTDMSNMFYNCSGLTSLDLSTFNTSKVVDMRYMFYNCSGLTTIYVSSSWTTSAVSLSDYMFSSCSKLVGGNGTKYSSSYTNVTYARIDKSGQKGYLTEKQ